MWSRPVLGLAVLVAVSLPATAAAGPRQTRIETPVRSSAPDARLVAESYVQLYAPLPTSAPPHPSSCDWLGYLRFRAQQAQRRPTPRRRPSSRPRRSRSPAFTGGSRARTPALASGGRVQAPPSPSQADAVVVAMPGFLGGAASFDQLARNVVAQAARRGKRVEFWALDRRANCLEDHRGTEAAARARDYLLALRYYFHGQEVGGRRFQGFKTSDQVPFLDGFGLARTLRDEYTVITRELPDPRARARKVLCGGHSLGEPLTAAFAAWDFDGDPRTTADAGYRQCAGFFGLDTSLALGGGSRSGTPGVGGVTGALLSAGGQRRFIDVPPATPETLQLLGPSGVAAHQRPREESRFLQLVPSTPKIELTFRLLFSRNAVDFATGNPSVRDFRITNEVLIGGVFDDNSSPISIFRSSVGVYDGGPVTDKNFPLPTASALFTGDDRLMAPAEPHGPLYGWRNYDRVGVPGAPRQVDSTGQPYTSRASEVSDVRQLARAMFEAPADLVEQYFPTRIMTDVAAVTAGDRSGEFENLRYADVPKRNSLLIQAADGIGDGSSAGAERSVTLPGYNHLDVVTAAGRQNDGKPEGSSTALTGLVLRVLGAPARTQRR